MLYLISAHYTSMSYLMCQCVHQQCGGVGSLVSLVTTTLLSDHCGAYSMAQQPLAGLVILEYDKYPLSS